MTECTIQLVRSSEVSPDYQVDCLLTLFDFLLTFISYNNNSQVQM